MNTGSKAAPARGGRTGGAAVEPVSSSALDLAKWLIPSVTGLFAVIGYVVRSAHSGLIGREVDFSSGPGYAGAASDFARDLPTIAIDALLDSGQSLSFAGHARELVIAGAALALVLVLAAWTRKRERTPFANALAVTALLGLLLWKFAFLDAPLTRVEGIVIATGAGLVEEGQPTTWSIQVQALPSNAAAQPGEALQRFIAAKADCAYRSIVRNRMRQSASAAEPLPGQGLQACPADAETRADLQRGEFVSRVVASAFVAGLALLVIRQRALWANVVGFVALASLLTLPYAYGKLMVPSYFEVGRVLLADALVKASALDLVLQQDRGIDAIVLSRRGPEVDLLVMAPGICPGETADGKPRMYQVGRLWTVPTSQILSIREIHREDVIAWKLQNERGCGKSSARPHLG
jgi:hypothetical protein